MTKESSKRERGEVAQEPARERQEPARERQEPPRDRIVACAQDLFHRHGIRGVGVEAIAEAAGTNKMTLYRHFDSKDDLILEYLNRKGRMADELWAEIEALSPGDPAGQLHGFVHEAARRIACDERGCDLANATVELTEAGHPGLKVIEDFKVRQRDRLAKLCEAAHASQPGLLADAIVLLIEGAQVSRQSVGAEGPSASLVSAGEAVIVAFGVAPSVTAGPRAAGPPSRSRSALAARPPRAGGPTSARS
ncbi:TetR family transcriptional regulator [Roseiarcus fermentans]|uniref:TetR family transcriptional regulator n=1 Tax=Roseiarcus fermentans TaxID=1473586 RepID=A0A366ENW3_9HYPH|nr:TetR family transcriptional regulator [Roseiarcus fermentans]